MASGQHAQQRRATKRCSLTSTLRAHLMPMAEVEATVARLLQGLRPEELASLQAENGHLRATLQAVRQQDDAELGRLWQRE